MVHTKKKPEWFKVIILIDLVWFYGRKKIGQYSKKKNYHRKLHISVEIRITYNNEFQFKFYFYDDNKRGKKYFMEDIRVHLKGKLPNYNG